MSVVRSTMVDGRWPVMDFGVPPLSLAEVRTSGPFSSRSLGNNG